MRRHRRVGNVAWGDLAYRVYTTALGTIVLVIFASGLIGDAPLDKAAQAQVLERGPEWAGLIAGILFLFGSRSGARGGPLALEAADVHNLLLAPLPRSRVLRRPSIGSIGYGSAAGMAVGALAGLLFAQRMPGGNAAYISSGALFGATVAAGALGFAFLTASRKLPIWLLPAVAALLSVASVAHLTGTIGWAPLSTLGKIPFWRLEFDPISVVFVLIIAALAALGVMFIGGLSVEAAQRRTRLVGQLRFAVTQQDLRSVMLLRRQLASELPSSRNRLRFLSRPLGKRVPVVSRGLSSIGRWPTIRIIRVLVLCSGSMLVSRWVWMGTTPLVLLAGTFTFLAALDSIEPLAQEIDHPLMVDSYPQERGVIFQRHLVVPIVVMLANLLVGFAVVSGVWRTPDLLPVLAITAVTAAIAGVSGAAISVVGEAILSAVDEAMMPPEVAGPRVVFRMLWPPMVAISGFAPLIAAQRAMRDAGDPLQPALMAALIPLALTVAVVAWVKFRDELHDTMNEAMGR